jgi:hypothetical protein
VNTTDTTNAAHRHDDIETLLRGELAGRAGGLSVGDAPYPAVNRAARRDRNRRRAAAASGLVLAAALAGTLPYALSGSHGSTSVAVAGAPSPLLTAPLRGNLAGDSAFIAAVKQRLDTSPSPAPPGAADMSAPAGYNVLYANDDGTHRVAISAAYTGKTTLFAVLVGPHGASVSALKAGGHGGANGSEATFTYLGAFTGAGASVPFVVLGPTSMTGVEYATGLTLGSVGGKLTSVRTGVEQATTVNGAAAGEIADTGTPAEVERLNILTAFRAELGGKHVDVDPVGRDSPALPGEVPGDSAYDAIRSAVAQKGRQAGLSMSAKSPGGDAVPDNVAVVLVDLAHFAAVPVGSIGYHVDWIGHETAQWDSALLDVSVPGLPKLQIFVRGLAAGVPDSASPGLGQSFVRAAVTLTPGHLPETAAAFGGTREPSVVGYELVATW